MRGGPYVSRDLGFVMILRATQNPSIGCSLFETIWKTDCRHLDVQRCWPTLGRRRRGVDFEGVC